MQIVKVENDTLVRDVNSNAILETDLSKLQQHRAMRKALAEREDKDNSDNDSDNEIQSQPITSINLNTSPITFTQQLASPLINHLNMHLTIFFANLLLIVSINTF